MGHQQRYGSQGPIAHASFTNMQAHQQRNGSRRISNASSVDMYHAIRESRKALNASTINMNAYQPGQNGSRKVSNISSQIEMQTRNGSRKASRVSTNITARDTSRKISQASNLNMQTFHNPLTPSALSIGGQTDLMRNGKLSPYSVGRNSVQPSSNISTTSVHNEDNKDCCCVFCSILVATSIPVTMLVLGILNLRRCPLEETIPKYLIASGTISFYLVLLIVIIIHSRVDSNHRPHIIRMFTFGFLCLLGVQIWGSIVIYKKWPVWQKNVDLKNDPYIGCDADTFLIGFSLLTIFWLLLPFLIIFLLKSS